ncbi:MAG: sulfotransferase [Chloroflexi bacterium]|nr:sulfotransferase [Chloroflexota bacterium]
MKSADESFLVYPGQEYSYELFKNLFKAKEKPVVYVVSGLPRSGTSMMMKMLAASVPAAPG